MAATAVEQSDQLRDLVLPGGATPILRSPEALKLMSMVKRVAPSPAAVLICGETGSGKEVIARAIHHLSLRCGKAWVDVNCGALPEHLVESELFGYEKGAFSGADQVKPGLFEMAHDGTLFLDEIGELDPRIQVKLLRVLDGVPYYRLGGTKKITVNVRIVAATNRDLEEAVRSGKFRSDLYHRLTQFTIHVPPLRERPEDIEAIAIAILGEYKAGAHFTPEAMECLRRYTWPGNVRELKNVIVRTTLTIDPHQYLVRASDLPMHVRAAAAAEATTQEIPIGDLDSMERLMIERALERTGGDQGLAAEQLGISRRTLSRKLKLYAVDVSRTMGRLDEHQERYFRASVECPVTLRAPNGTVSEATVVNLSSSGVGLQDVGDPLKFTGTIDVIIKLPDTNQPLEAKCRMTWADAQGRAGLRFVSITADDQQRLDSWLASKREEEGWAKIN